MIAADPLGGADMVYGAAERARTSATVYENSSSIALITERVRGLRSYSRVRTTYGPKSAIGSPRCKDHPNRLATRWEKTG